MLEDNSADVPPTTDLAAAAEASGRRARRRRYVVGGLGTAAALAVGFTVIPGLFTDDSAPGGDDNPALAATVTPTPTTRPDVDLSLVGTTVAWAGGVPGAAAWVYSAEVGADPRSFVVRPDGGRMLVPVDGASSAFTGTVLGFTTPSDPPADSGAVSKVRRSVIGIRIKVDRTLADGAPLGADSAGETVVTLALYSRTKDDDAKLAAQLTKAVPAGVRVAGTVSATDDPATYSALALVFEDEDGTPTGGPYSTPKARDPWSKAKTFDEAVTLIEQAQRDCPKFDFPRGDSAGNRKLITIRLKELAKVLDQRPLCAVTIASGAQVWVKVPSSGGPLDEWTTGADPKDPPPTADPTKAPASPGPDPSKAP